jgi:hypothetical protein
MHASHQSAFPSTRTTKIIPYRCPKAEQFLASPAYNRPSPTIAVGSTPRAMLMCEKTDVETLHLGIVVLPMKERVGQPYRLGILESASVPEIPRNERTLMQGANTRQIQSIERWCWVKLTILNRVLLILRRPLYLRLLIDDGERPDDCLVVGHISHPITRETNSISIASSPISRMFFAIVTVNFDIVSNPNTANPPPANHQSQPQKKRTAIR